MSKQTSKVANHDGPDHSAQLKRLNRIRGQVDGVGRMIEEQRYCPDILAQSRAVRAALRALEAEILRGHLRHCVQDAMAEKDPQEMTRKLDELLDLFKKNPD